MMTADPEAERTPSSEPLGRVAAAERLLAAADGSDREQQVYQVFTDEVAEVLRPDALALDPAERAACWALVADLADKHLTEDLRLRLPTEKRVRLSLAQHRDAALLEAALAEPAPRFLLEDGRLYARYPGFREEPHDLPDAWFEAATERVTARLARGVKPRYLVWTGVRRSDYALEYSCHLPVEGLGADAVRAGAVRLAAGDAPRKGAAAPAAEAPGPEVEAEVEVRPEGALTAVTARVRTSALTGGGPGRWSLRLYATLRDFTYDLPLKAPRGYFQRHGFPRGLTAEFGDKRALAIKVDERATLRGLGRIKLLDFRK